MIKIYNDGDKKFDNIIKKWKQTKVKEILYINKENKVGTRDFDIYEIFKGYLNDGLDWMVDKNGYKQTAEEVGANYMKAKNDNVLKLIKDFITKINNGAINNKNKAGNEFRKLKQKVTNDTLRQDLIKDLERYIFGEDIFNIEPEEKYEESIGERIKTRRQNTELLLHQTHIKNIFLQKLLII